MELTKLIKDCLTETDGVSYCPIRVMGVPSALALVATYSITAIHAATVDLQAFGVGGAALLGGIASLGASLGYKAKTESVARIEDKMK